MTNDKEVNDFSSGVTETTMSVVKTIANNFAQSGSSVHSSDIIQPVEQSNLEVSTPESSTMISIVTERAETLATSAVRKLVKATLSISTSMSSTQLSDTSLVTGQPSSYPSNLYSVTDLPVPTTTSFEAHDLNEIVINNASEERPTTHLPLADIGNENSAAAAHDSMQNHIQNLNSPHSIKYLIEKLQEKLSDVQGSSPEDLHSLSFPNPHSSGFPPHKHDRENFSPSVQYASERPTFGGEEFTKISNSSQIFSNTSDILDNNSDNVILHSDTIILVSSMVCMIIMGLALYKLMEYLTKKNRRKIMVGHGLKQIGEHMNVVTRTMSADPSGPTPKSTPKPVRKRPLVDSPSTARVLREVRRGTVFKPPTYMMRRDDDMDFGLGFQTASQEAHNNRIRYEENVELQIHNEFVDNERKH